MPLLLTYTELLSIADYRHRLQYLIQHGAIGIETFGYRRILNQKFYRSREWRQVRDFVIVRDDGCDLAIPDMEIEGRVYVHHMNPITPHVLLNTPDIALDPEFLISASTSTHQRIHYANPMLLDIELAERRPGDTKSW